MSVDKLEKELKEVQDKLNEAKKNQFLTCGKCGQKTQIKKIDLVQNQWYEEPVG